MAPRYRRAVAALAVLLAATACSGGAAPTAGRPTAPSPAAGGTATGSTVASPSTSGAAAPAVDPAAVHADELGAVPVLMFHQVVAAPAGEYDQTPGQFRAVLEQLYSHGFRTVTAADLVARHLDLPAGAKPMVLTFDDSTVSQYGEAADGTVRPDTAVGLLLAVGRAHGEERPVATFYVNGAPFGGHPEYLAHLHALGMELGDHTLTHANLRRLDDAGAQRELAAGLQVITSAVPGAEVTTMALPYGVFPHAHALASTGAGYRFAAVMLVGANPAPSPYSAAFDPLNLPRIRSGRLSGDQAFTAAYWLPRLFDGQVAPYVSDGDPSRVSFPRAVAARLAAPFAAQARPY